MLFGSAMADVTECEPDHVFRIAQKAVATVQEKYTVLPLVLHGGELLPAMNLLGHSHFVNYGGKHRTIQCCK
jgi:hypothetical protein